MGTHSLTDHAPLEDRPHSWLTLKHVAFRPLLDTIYRTASKSAHIIRLERGLYLLCDKLALAVTESNRGSGVVYDCFGNRRAILVIPRLSGEDRGYEQEAWLR